jgi:hypothetical protein
MAGIYFIIIITLASIASIVGLLSSLMIMPEATNEEIYFFAGKVAIGAIILIVGIIFVLLKTGHIKIEESLIKEGRDGEED